MGLSRSDLNLEVAKKENSVILLEDNFKDTNIKDLIPISQNP
jgi:N-acetylmuramoyl-L-alanine amidase